MKTIVVSAASSGTGKTWLARHICRLLQNSVRVKIGHGEVKRGDDGFFYPLGTSVEKIVADHRQAHFLVIESNGVLRQLSPDCTIYLAADNPKPSALLCKSRADIIRGQALSAETVATLSQRLGIDKVIVRKIAWLAASLPSPLTGIILAGGKSSRMGDDKPFLTMGRETLVECIHRQLSLLCGRILVVTNRRLKSRLCDYEVIVDELEGKGPLMGICSGLAASTTELNFVIACDIPCAPVEQMAQMLSCSEDADIVVPLLAASGGEQPLFGVYRRSVLPEAVRSFSAGNRSIMQFIDACKTVRMRVEDEGWYANLNTPLEFQHYIKTVSALQPGEPASQTIQRKKNLQDEDDGYA
ncbi:MAG: molybdenum cofactor guanylyltransferase [Chitinivibrionales bacterium]|nr:molybdenum cofactor guanylyltransferase [Chitinivibrionales bacterium]